MFQTFCNHFFKFKIQIVDCLNIFASPIAEGGDNKTEIQCLFQSVALFFVDIPLFYSCLFIAGIIWGLRRRFLPFFFGNAARYCSKLTLNTDTIGCSGKTKNSAVYTRSKLYITINNQVQLIHTETINVEQQNEKNPDLHFLFR